MTLQELFVKLRTNTPNRRQFVWITDIGAEEPIDGDFAGAVGRAKCELEDKIRNRDGIYIGTTISLAKQLEAFTLERINSDLIKVCEDIDGLAAIASDD